MRYFGEDKPSLEEVLAHHGVKGMRWGVRRQMRQERNAQIKSARKRIRAKENEIHSLDKQARKSKSAAERTRLDNISTKKAAALFNSPDHSTAARLTTGEKVTKGLIIGSTLALAGALGAARAVG